MVLVRTWGIAAAFVMFHGCATTLSQRASELRWVSHPQEVAGCGYLGIVDGSSTQTGAAASTGRNNARNEALEKAAHKGATHVRWLTNDDGFGSVRITAEVFDCGQGSTRFARTERVDAEAGFQRLARPVETASVKPADVDRDAPMPSTESAPTVTRSFGSCFFVSRDGIAITNRHVVDGAKSIVVIDAKNEKHHATILRRSPDMDLVALDVPSATTHAAVPIATRSALALGQSIFTVGFPYPEQLGFDPKFADGAIAGLRGGGDDRLLQVTIPLQPGNSGGPVATDAGVVIGVVVSKLNALAVLKETGTLPENVNFAIKSSELSSLLRGVAVAPHAVARSRTEAVTRVQEASCQVVALMSEVDPPPGYDAPGSTRPRSADSNTSAVPNAEGGTTPLSKEQVSAGVAAIKPKLIACNDAEEGSEIAAARVSVEVDAAGTVSSVRVDGSMQPSHAVRACIAKTFRAARFAKSGGGRFSYTVRLTR